MAQNWPPSSYPVWPPPEAGANRLEFGDLATAIFYLTDLGFTRANPTTAENNQYFKNVRCDENHPCSGIILVSPSGVRYPFAYCTGAAHKCVLVLWVVGYDSLGNPSYDLGYNSGVIG